MLLTVRDVAQQLNVSPGCVYSLVARFEIAHVRIGAGRGTIRIREEDLGEYLTGQRREKGEEPLAAPRPRLKHLRYRSIPR